MRFGGYQVVPVKIVIDAVGLSEKIKVADLVITGEGRMDAQSVSGKTPIGVQIIDKVFFHSDASVASLQGKL
ncbi:glycerate kinase [Ursidibacter arcticus]|uniref:glycerate kinase n=1 Tax=Ursidibacter arcticus TaxID=1524965 RepID=UPI0012F85103|nr:glycerate kinase [Ursidibacter arcticus]